MRRKTAAPPSPLPQRQGVDPVRVRLPFADGWATVGDYLIERLSGAAPGAVAEMLDSGLVVGADGNPVAARTPYSPGRYLWFHRDLPPEVPVPFPLEVVHRDDHLVVVDKPHFLATTPRGSHVTETVLARLRRELGIPGLGAAHRLDRLTAGLVLLVVRPEERGTYQTLFSQRRVRKEYEAIAPYDPSLAVPRTVRSRILKERGVPAAREIDGEPNAETLVELAGHREGLGRYRLTPHTGQTHQLRVHMSALGVPILGDPLYPVVTGPVPDGDFRRPLQLLARSLEFTDPVTGVERRLRSRRALRAWESYEDWAAP
ncbi:RluA family pseudouridine synthase [Streptomyces shenzhenensis]|uniref:RluA family pseudouridine synthase n=1 Tax=Streptomyces shenzhenensis TaxID=943815 RepID=UPI001F193687|nr:RluA family pseudouridine synthase [Streptomyces shenzhenensis]